MTLVEWFNQVDAEDLESLAVYFDCGDDPDDPGLDAGQLAAARADARLAGWFRRGLELKREGAPDWTAARAALDAVADLKTCPRCGETKPAGKGFGWRNMGDGTIRSQSWCARCRSLEAGHDGPPGTAP